MEFSMRNTVNVTNDTIIGLQFTERETNSMIIDSLTEFRVAIDSHPINDTCLQEEIGHGEIGLDSLPSTNAVFPWTDNAITLLDID